MPDFYRYSEPVPPSGGLQGKGVLNLLGKPPLDPLTLVLREAAQNAWDARLKSGTPSMLVRYRVLDDAEADHLRAFLLEAQANAEEIGKDSLAEQLRKRESIPVLEICDFGTFGLNGGVDPVHEISRFTKFFFDIGNPHFDGSTGGTYGFGRSSLYLASEQHTIVADSFDDSGKRRLMACRLGPSFATRRGKRHTGRHFWGIAGARDIPVSPLAGSAALRLAKRLGLPERDDRNPGTTIMIPWPKVDPTTASDSIPEILYHNLWPKLVRGANGKVPMKLEVEVDGRRQNLDIAKAHGIYTSFALALIKARTKKSPAKEIGPLRPAVVGGYVAVEPAHNPVFPEAVDSPVDTFEAFRDGVCHVALMRSSELVVRYRKIELGATEPWVGVLVANADPEISAAFAGAEPPAHDDWNPKLLGGTDSTIVKMTLKRLPDSVGEILGIKKTPTPAGTHVASLAAAADHFAAEFLRGMGTAAAPTDGPGGGGGGAARAKLSSPEFVGFLSNPHQTVALYQVNWSGDPGQVLEAHADVAIEGGVLDSDEGIALPKIIEWIAPGGKSTQGYACRTTEQGTYRISVSFGAEYAMQLEVHEVA